MAQPMKTLSKCCEELQKVNMVLIRPEYLLSTIPPGGYVEAIPKRQSSEISWPAASVKSRSTIFRRLPISFRDDLCGDNHPCSNHSVKFILATYNEYFRFAKHSCQKMIALSFLQF